MIDLQAIKSQVLKDAGEEQESKYFAESSHRSKRTSTLGNPEQKRKLERRLEAYQREVSILAKLSHVSSRRWLRLLILSHVQPNIIKLEQIIRSDDTM